MTLNLQTLVVSPRSINAMMKFIPVLLPIAQEIAEEIMPQKVQKKKEKKKSGKKKVGKKKAVTRKKKAGRPRKKLDSKHDYCRCGKPKLKKARLCRSCYHKSRKKK